MKKLLIALVTLIVIVLVETPGKRKVAAVTEFLDIAPQELVKTMVYLADGKPVAVLVRGDHEVQEVKLKNMLGAVDVELADDKQIFDATGVPSGCFHFRFSLRNSAKNVFPGCRLCPCTLGFSHLPRVQPGAALSCR